ncbi:MerC domain-containing protein [uncultured Pseudoteredinibacter sp.]|uniref:MerC domain-containing protein n=1 Tax=uncultured Pseudoteredinibacter sp. TaxID=1641701 RepID=UPI00261BA854|nr:MerC domain-containing protein [uncultured Pseudoteredinibacter sp.]
MIKVSQLGDKFAISLSALCSIHCLATPIVLAALPSLTGLALLDEAFHSWMVLAVVPCSLLSLLIGCREHRQRSVAELGLIGIAILLTPLILGHEAVGELGEKTLSVVAAIVIALAHWKNYRLCQAEQCSCNNKTN